ncbi:MAG: O-antigen ligase family protein [FCB group bacterium]|nr:O-antigen ligase family protein [FCB group bacterium]
MTDLSLKAEMNFANVLQIFFKYLLTFLGFSFLIFLFVTRPIWGLALLALLAAGFFLLFSRIAFFIFLVTVSLYTPFRISHLFALHPFDIMMALVFLGMALDFLLRGHTEIRPALFDGLFIILITATFISALFAYNRDYSIVPLFRTTVIYFAFRAAFKFGFEIGVRKIIVFYLYLVFFHSLINIILFFITAGQIRIFGLPGLGYEPFAMTALPMAAAFMIWAKSGWEQFRYGIISLIIGLGVLATQSRAPLLAVIIAIPVLIIFTGMKAHREKTKQPLRTMKKVFIPVFLVGALFIFFSGTLFAGALGRYEHFIESFTKPQGTVALRLILWKTAIRTFLDHPFTGIGIGNFRLVHQLYPDIRTNPLWYQIKGMSAHNVILHYLAETGLIGSLALLALAIKGIKISYHDFKKKLSLQQNQVSAALFIAMFVYCLTILYMRAWMWGQDSYIMALIFGLNAAWFYQTRRQIEAE